MVKKQQIMIIVFCNPLILLIILFAWSGQIGQIGQIGWNWSERQMAKM
jgi:hypothetical protein